MTGSQILIIAILIAAIGLFLWGRWRHDVVALAALLACALLGLIPSDAVFAGFGHPAVITVAAVLILSSGLQSTGAIDSVARRLLPREASPFIAGAALTALAIVLSAFMNNVGALALLMPVALQLADRQNVPPGKILMPLAFGSILGGMTTLIGTPPNLIVAGFRQETSGQGFEMFDFSGVGIAVALIGVVFVTVAGRFLVPARERAGAKGFETGAYLTEARVPEQSKAVGMMLQDVEQALADADALVIGLVRGDRRIPAPSRFREIHAEDILLIEAEPEALAPALRSLGLRFGENLRSSKAVEAADEAPVEEGDSKERSRELSSDEIVLAEMAILPNASLQGRSATSISLRTRYGINLLAISRQGRRSTARLRTTTLRTGDVLLMQGTPEALSDFAVQFGCVPLAERAVGLPAPGKALTAVLVMIGAIVLSATGLVAPATAFAGAVLMYLLLQIVSPRQVYQTIDWPVIVLLAALIPVANAMASTGAADWVARVLLDEIAQGRPVIGLGLILIVSMTLSDFMNNAATAAVMCPIAIGTAERLGASSDPFLMAVAVGASCAFLTPIGHQNNTLILGPGGFRFGDYWRLGLPLEILVVAVGVPMILMVWPLAG